MHIVNLLIINRAVVALPMRLLGPSLRIIIMVSLYSDSKGKRASEIHSINIRTCD